jgi:hypothetical protein
VLWRQDAGIARFFIQIEDIFPGEAVPVPTLLQELIQAADCPWRHFYLQD